MSGDTWTLTPPVSPPLARSCNTPGALSRFVWDRFGEHVRPVKNAVMQSREWYLWERGVGQHPPQPLPSIQKDVTDDLLIWVTVVSECWLMTCKVTLWSPGTFTDLNLHWRKTHLRYEDIWPLSFRKQSMMNLLKNAKKYIYINCLLVCLPLSRTNVKHKTYEAGLMETQQILRPWISSTNGIREATHTHVKHNAVSWQKHLGTATTHTTKIWIIKTEFYKKWFWTHFKNTCDVLTGKREPSRSFVDETFYVSPLRGSRGLYLPHVLFEPRTPRTKTKVQWT